MQFLFQDNSKLCFHAETSGCKWIPDNVWTQEEVSIFLFLCIMLKIKSIWGCTCPSWLLEEIAKTAPRQMCTDAQPDPGVGWFFEEAGNEPRWVSEHFSRLEPSAVFQSRFCVARKIWAAHVTCRASSWDVCNQHWSLTSVTCIFTNIKPPSNTAFWGAEQSSKQKHEGALFDNQWKCSKLGLES